MRTYRLLSLPLIVLIFCFAVLPSSLAQESLPTIVKKIEPSIVVITTYDKEGKILGQGSGFFISKNGNVITNRHVLQGANRAEVKTPEGKLYSITRVLAEDKEGDLIRVSTRWDFLPDQPQEVYPILTDEDINRFDQPEIPKDWTFLDEVEIEVSPPTGPTLTTENEVYPVSISTSIPQVGERVIVVGAPLGLEKTVSDGIISAVRDIPSFGKIIQITAPISPGSSGSPVLNMKGEVIGVTTFLLVEGQNLNFAVPAERVAKLTPGKGQTLAEWQAGRTEEWLTSAEGLYYTGLIFLWAKNYEKALPYFQEAVKKNSRYAEAYFQIGYCNDNLERYNEAIEAYKQVIRINPDDAETHSNLGSVYYGLGRYDKAIEACKQAIRINSNLAPAHANLGLAYYNLERYNEAIEAYKQAIRINPDDAVTHSILGLVYYKLGRYDKGIEAYKQAIRIKPDDALVHYSLGLGYLSLGDMGSSLEQYKILKNLDKDLANELFNLIYK